MRNNYSSKHLSKQAKCRFRLYMLAMLLLLISSGTADAQSLYLKKFDASLSIYSLENIRSLVISKDDDFIINRLDESPLTIPASSIQYFSFREFATRLGKTKVQGEQMSLYPNPADRKLNIMAVMDSHEPGTIEILSLDGKVFFKEKFSSKMRPYQADISALPPGLYLCKIQMGNDVEILKFWKN